MSLANPLLNLLGVAINLLALLITVRILLSWFPAVHPWHPTIRAMDAVVQPVLRPFRAILPTFNQIDFSPLLAILVLYQLGSIVSGLAYGSGFSVAHVLVSVAAALVLNIIVVFCVVVLARLLISLFHADPWHPLVVVVRQLSSPLMRPFGGRTRGSDTTAAIALGVYLLLYVVARVLFDVLLAPGRL